MLSASSDDGAKSGSCAAGVEGAAGVPGAGHAAAGTAGVGGSSKTWILPGTQKIITKTSDGGDSEYDEEADDGEEGFGRDQSVFRLLQTASRFRDGVITFS
jgi:hypothetical protein